MSNKRTFAEHPKAQYWHPTQNGVITPNMVSYGSAKKCWFKCPNNDCLHDFQADPNHITALNKPTWCPYCSKSHPKICSDENCTICYNKSFKSFLDQKDCNLLWEDSNKLNPRFISKCSNTKFNLKCKICSHINNTKLGNTVCLLRSCPYCCIPPKRLCEESECKDCFEKSFASHIRSIHWDSNKNKEIPRNVFKSTPRKYWFICEQKHSFDSALSHVSNTKEPRWCPYCNGTNEKALQCFERSFASHENSKYWDYEKNTEIPRNVFKGTSDKYWFNCICGHSYDCALSHISSINNPRYCPYCCVPPKRLCEDNKDGHCSSCFEKSFASFEKSNCFNEKENKVLSSSVFKGDNDKYWFKCDNCTHNFYQAINVIIHGSWCHYCSGHKLCEDNECKDCFEKSFASHDKVKYFDPIKNQIVPRSIHKQSSQKYWFICENNHSFDVMISNLYPKIGRSASWCPHCIHKTEQKLYEKISQLYSIEQQYRVDWCKKKSFLPFDFVLEELKIIIELDGPQHFKIICDKWRSPEEEQENDKYKMLCANSNGFSVIRLLQEDVYYDTYDWVFELDENIKRIIQEKKINNIFMCKNNEYDCLNL
jgi:very-short-patch-repair endonuclease